MCGIVGYKSKQSREPQVLERMLSATAYRGPDHRALFHSGDFHGGYNRLTITGGATGTQPFVSEDESVAVFYNGEIYNHRELKAELEKSGVSFRGTSDGEVICHLYRRHGARAFSLLDGMFAIAVWDSAQRKLLLARDLAGEKPLYFHKLAHDEIIFTSDLSALKYFPGFQPRVNLQAVRDYLSFHWVPDPETIYAGVSALMPGSVLEVNEAGFRFSRIENPYSRDFSALSDAEAVSATRDAVLRAIEKCLPREVRAGSFLSGGVDSSLVSIVARRHLELHTFSVGFEDIDDPLHGKYDESIYAGELAAKIGSIHHRVLLREQEFFLAFSELTRLDQPFANPAALGVMLVGKEAREHGVKVLLSGDGSDEASGGYPWYPFLPAIERISLGGRARPGEDLCFMDAKADFDARLHHLAALPPAQRALSFHLFTTEARKAKLAHPDFLRSTLGSERFFAGLLPDSPAEYLHHDRSFFSPNENLRRTDLLLMKCSVEGRAPFASREILALSERLSFSQKVRGEKTKWALKEAVADLLPPEIFTRPKHGFTVPVEFLFSAKGESYVRETFAPGSRLSALGVLPENAEGMLREFRADPQRQSMFLIYSAVLLEHWLRQQGL